MAEKLDENAVYLPQRIEVNRDELLRILTALEESMTKGARIYQRLDNLIKQGVTPRKASDEAEKE